MTLGRSASLTCVIGKLVPLLLGSQVLASCSHQRLEQTVGPPIVVHGSGPLSANSCHPATKGEVAVPSASSRVPTASATQGDTTSSVATAAARIPRKYAPPNLDVTGDGRADIVVPGEIWSPAGKGAKVRDLPVFPCTPPEGTTFSDYCPGNGYWEPVGDIDGDGFGDAWVSVPQTQIWFGSVEGIKASDIVVCVQHQCKSFYISPLGDFDGDGFNDVLMTGESSQIAFSRGRAPMQFESIPDADFAIAAGDVDGDNFADVFVAWPKPRLIFGCSQPTSNCPQLPITLPDSIGDAFGRNWQVTADGRESLIVQRAILPERVVELRRWQIRDRKATQLRSIRIPGRESAFGQELVKLGDIDGDGVTDVAWNGSTGPRVAIYIASTRVNSLDTRLQVIRIPGDVRDIKAVGDVNGDGLDDFVIPTWTDEAEFARLYYGTRHGRPKLATIRQL